MSKEKQALVTKALAHEFYRCTDSFISFNYYLDRKDLKSKRNRILCYNSYVDFLAHLYEFYIKIIEKSSIFQETGIYENYPSFEDIGNLKKTDIILAEEVAKLMRNRKNRIVHGYKDNLGLDISFYDQKVPKEFGEHFRFTRNRRNHVDRKHVIDSEISLTDFYRKYHDFVVILFKEAFWVWDISDDNFDLKEIESFATEIEHKQFINL